MMKDNKYILLDKIKIDRPIVFLCGPYYKKDDEGDRRRILKSEIMAKYHNNILPLIIDDFLTLENIDDPQISLQLMEEICADISVKTYIFLDTLSSAAELGMFASSAYGNKIQVLIPKADDIYNKGNVGFFVKEIALKSKQDMITTLEYRPAVRRNAIATDYIVEFYSFVNNKLPLNIRKSIDSDCDLKEFASQKDLIIIESTDMSHNPYEICYSIDNDNLQIKLSIKLLFYVTLSILACEYKDFFSRKDNDFGKIDLDEIEIQTQCAFLELIKIKSPFIRIKPENISFHTNLKKEQNDKLIKHIVKFLYVFNTKSDYGTIQLFKDPLGKIIDLNPTGNYLGDVINFTKESFELIEQISNEPNMFYEKIQIKTARKKRDIVRYRDDDNGKKAKELHKCISKCLKRVYSYSDNSYAYKEGEGIKTCVTKHLSSIGFVKYDIKKFFDSIPIDKLVSKMMKELNIQESYTGNLRRIIRACSYDDKIPLGFVTSPILSDMYMKDIDDNISTKIKDVDYKYTRYADDMLISSNKAISECEFCELDNFINKLLSKNSLTINKKKSQYINFDKHHTFFRYLGINIVYNKDGNSLSLGRTYINNVAKEYIDYDKEKKKNSVKQDRSDGLFYSRMRVIGKIGFIKQIEGCMGLERLKRRLFKYNPNLDLGNI